MDKVIVGIDPGKSGAAVAINQNMEVLSQFRFSTAEDGDLSDWLTDIWIDHGLEVIVVEMVHSMPGQGVKSTFSFGKSTGAIAEAVGLFSDEVTIRKPSPQAWQRDLDCMTGGNKNITKDLAQKLFPDVKVIHANADALLLAEWGRREYFSNSLN